MTYPMLTTESKALLEVAKTRFEGIQDRLGEQARDAVYDCLGITPEPLSYLSELRKDREITSFEEVTAKGFVTWVLNEVEKLKPSLKEVELEDLHAELQEIISD